MPNSILWVAKHLDDVPDHCKTHLYLMRQQFDFLNLSIPLLYFHNFNPNTIFTHTIYDQTNRLSFHFTQISITNMLAPLLSCIHQNPCSIKLCFLTVINLYLSFKGQNFQFYFDSMFIICLFSWCVFRSEIILSCSILLLVCKWIVYG